MAASATRLPESKRAPTEAGLGWRWLGFSRREHLLALALFAGLTLLFFFPVLRGDTFSDVAGRQQQVYPWASVTTSQPRFPALHYDQDESFYPWQVFMSRELKAGQFPFWNPYSFGGQPFFANGQSGVLYPPRLALTYWVSPTRVHDILLASHFFLAGVTMFLLLAFVGLSFPAALVGGLAWMLNSFALAWQALEHYIVIEAWLPLAVLLVHAVVRRRSWPAASALSLVLGLMFIGGNALFVELAILTVFGYGVVLAIADARHDRRRLAGAGARLATTAVLLGGMTMILSLPALRVAAESTRVSLSYGQLGQFALPWHSLVNFVKAPDFAGREPYHHDLFAGTAVAVLALVGMLRRNALALFATLLGLLALAFMLHTPVTFAVDHALPGFSNFKPLARAAFLLQFSLAVLSAFGMETLLRRLPAAREAIRRRLTRVDRRGAVSFLPSPLLLGGLVGIGAELLILRIAGRGFASSALGIASAAGIVVAIGASWQLLRHELRPEARLSALPRLRPGLALLVTTAVAASVVAQEWRWARQVMPHQPDAAAFLYPETPLIQFLQAHPGSRFLPTYPVFRGSTAMIFGIQSAGGYESLLPGRIESFWRVIGDGIPPRRLHSEPLVYAYHPAFELAKQRPALLARAGVDYVVAPPTLTPQAPVQKGLAYAYAHPDGRVYSVAHALPRVQLLGGCDVVPDAQSALERFVQPAFDAGASVIIEKPYLDRAGGSCGGAAGEAGAAHLLQRSLNTLTLGVDARRPGWLVVRESWDPGWKATIDGRPATLVPGDYVFRALAVPAGSHVVRLSYESAAFRVGTIISATSFDAALAALVLPVVWPRLRRRRQASPRTRRRSRSGIRR